MLIFTWAAWDGVGSSIVGSIIGGFLGGATVAVSLWVTIRHEGNVRRKDAERQTKAEERHVANELLITVHDLRDAAVRSRAGSTGDFSMWPRRKQMLLAESTLAGFTAYTETQAFYDHVYTYRDWARRNRRTPNESLGRAQRRALDELGSKVIWLMQHIHDRPSATLADVPVSVWSRSPKAGEETGDPRTEQ